jgi:hypothetical protein
MEIDFEDEAIRYARFEEGDLLGPMIDRFGADKVVRALSVMGVAAILGIDGRSPSAGSDG